MTKYLFSATILLFFGFNTSAQTVLLEEDFSEGIPATWTVYDQDGLTPAADVTEFTEGWVGYISGTDTAAASTSYYEPSGSANDYLVTPVLSLGNFSKIVWSARSVDASYPDGYQVLISTTDNAIASFTDTLLTISEETPYLTTRSVELDLEGYANQDVYIAFQNNTNNGYILLIDDVVLYGAETAGITSPEDKLELSIYPNPASNSLKIQSAEIIEQINIYNLTGQCVLSNCSNEIDISQLESGTYFVNVSTTNGVITRQFIKN